jgi:hypothetical protein
MFPRVSLALFLLFIAGIAAYGQTITRAAQSRHVSADQTLVEVRAISLLRRLDDEVINYHSFGEFEADGRLARVSLQTFKRDLAAVNAEVESLMTQMPPGKLKNSIGNALASYRDGAFWWQQIDQPRVVHASALRSDFTHASTDTAYLSTVPYTVAIHWRQAHKYLGQAETLTHGRTTSLR